ncbi:MAG: efflux RND transporter periplasmic adaptor subunit [Alphaproteobacteria bacterium]|nr:efflux RND transporter periplasmic adaptor subunit [Alphaproteobacteria bacterium]
MIEKSVIKWPMISSIFLFLFVFLVPSAVISQQRASAVDIDKVISEPLLQTMPVIGRFVAKESGIVATRIAERVLKMQVQVGDRVEKGDVLVELASDRLDGQIQILKADLIRMESQLAKEIANNRKMKQTHKRILALRSSSAFRKDREEDSERDLEISKEMVTRAKADILQSKGKLKMGKIALQDANIKAPYPGVVLKQHTLPGNYVRVGDPIITLLNDTDLEIEVDVPSIRALDLKPGTNVKANLQNGLSFNAVIRAIIPQENSQTRAVAVRLTAKDGPFKQGIAGNQSVKLKLPIGDNANVVTVHKDAVLIKNGKKIVFVFKKGIANMQTTKLGRAIGNRFEVLAGLQPGDLVVVRGNERLRPGEPIKPNITR